MTALEKDAGRMTIETLRTADGQEKFGAAAGRFVRRKIGSCFVAEVLPPVKLTMEDFLPDIRDSEGKDGDIVLVLRDRNTLGDKHLVNVGVESTEIYVKTEPQMVMRAYDLLSIVSETVLREEQVRRSIKFLNLCEHAVAESGQVIELVCPPSDGKFLEDIKHPGVNDSIQPTTVLLSGAAALDLDCERTKSEVFGEMNRITSIRSDLFDRHNGEEKEESTLWLFSPANLLGDYLFYGDYHIWNRWEGPTWKLQGWEMSGLALSEPRGVTKVVIKY